MEIKLYKKYNSIDKDERSFIETNFLTSSEISGDWFRFLENTLKDYEPIYLVGIKNDQVIYFSTGYNKRKLDVGVYLSGGMKKFIKFLDGLRLNPLKFNVVFITHPLSNFSGIHGNDDRDILNEFLEGCREKIYRSINCDSVFISNISDELLSQQLKEAEFVRIPFYPNTELNTDFHTFEEYLQSLKKKKRWDVRNKQKVLNEYGAEIKILNCGEVEEYSQIYNLYTKTSLRNEDFPNIINYSEDSFNRWSDMNSSYKWITIHYNEEIIAFALIVEENDALIFKHVGMDYEHSTACFAYFNLYYVAISHAIKNGMKKMYCGPTTYEVKKSIGCELIDSNSFISIKNKLIGNFIIAVLTKAFG